MKRLVALFLTLVMAPAFSYSIFTIKPYNWSKVKSVDVFIAGYGEEMGLQFLYGAITRAQVHDDLYPDTRAQVIMWAEEWNKRKDRKVLRDRNFTILEINGRKLKNERIADYLETLPAISSLHLVTHNAAFQGNAIQRRSDRLGPNNFPWSKFTSKFTPDSYVFLHGCNTGFIVAPGISKALKRPVLGSLTSTDFEEIFADGNWYHNNPDFDQHPAGMRKLKTSGDLHAQTKSCWKGFCHRMTPNIHPYRGYWGNYEVGLPYYQAFCNYGQNQTTGDSGCRAGIKSAIEATATISPKSWEDKVLDFMCPRMADPTVLENCKAVLKGAETGRRVFWGSTTKCDLRGCDYQIKGGRNREGKKVNNFVGGNAGDDQLRKDYEFFMSLGQ